MKTSKEFYMNEIFGNLYKHKAFLSLCALTLISFIDPVTYTGTWLNSIWHYFSSLKIELIILTLAFVILYFPFRVWKVEKENDIYVIGRRDSDPIRLVDSLVKNKFQFLIFLIGIVIGGFIVLSSSITLLQSIKYRYTRTIPLRYRVMLVDEAKNLESQKRFEMALTKYEEIQKKYKYLNEIHFVNKRIKYLENKLIFANSLYEAYLNFDDRSYYNIDYLLYAIELNPANSEYNRELNEVIRLIEKDDNFRRTFFDANTYLSLPNEGFNYNTITTFEEEKVLADMKKYIK